MSSASNDSSKTTVLPPKSADTQERRGPQPGDRAWKDNNPKAAFGAAKVGIDYLSFPVLFEQAVGMMAGGYKYGAHNYLVAGPSVMTYVAACFRHLAAFTGGEEWDPHAGEGVKVHHLAAAMNCLHVVRAAMIAGIAYDDRPPAMPPGFIESLEPSIAALQKNNPDPVARYLANGKRGPGRIIGEKKPEMTDAEAVRHLEELGIKSQDQASRERADSDPLMNEGKMTGPERLEPDAPCTVDEPEEAVADVFTKPGYGAKRKRDF